VARRRRGRGRHSFKIPIISLAILAGQALYANASSGDALGKVAGFGSLYTGMVVGPGGGIGFRPDLLVLGYGPWVAKGLIGKFARAFGGVRVPFKLPISLS